MAAPAKYNGVMAVIKQRIQAGDYTVHHIPGERTLAEETGVSYMTARRAVQQLIAERVLIREPTGGLDIHPAYLKRANPAEIFLLYPAYPSSYLTQLRVLVGDAATRAGLALRPGQFVHWDEQVLVDVVAQAKGTLIIPYGPVIPARLLSHFKAHKVVILDGDFTEDGLSSIRLFSNRCIEQVLDHLWSQGHRHIDCLNSQNHNREIDRRIDIWDHWLKCKGGRGTLRDNPAAVFTDPTVQAHQLMKQLLNSHHCNRPTAIIATTCPGAIGAIRACYERKIRVGHDISICAVNLEPPAEFFCPSITGLRMPDMSRVLAQCFQWFTTGKKLISAKLLEPSDATLFQGESTQPIAKKCRKQSLRVR